MSMISAIKNLLNLGKMTRKAGDGVYQITVVRDETIDNVPFMQNFGFVSEPPKKSMALIGARAGKKDASVIITIENRSGAVTLSEGETVVYNNHGTSIHLKEDGSVEIEGGDLDIANGNLKINGVQVVTTQQPIILPPAGGGVVDAQARTAIGSIITTLQTHGLTL